MLTKIKNLSKRGKIALGAAAALLAAAGVGAAVWQPWNQAGPAPEDPVNPPQQVQTPAEPEVQGPTLEVGGETVDCTVYNGVGWSICVPVDWDVSETERGAVFGGGAMEVARYEKMDYAGTFASIAPGDGGGLTRMFYTGDGAGGSWSVAGAASANFDDQLLAGLARTLTVGEDKPFAESYVLPAEPDWQEAEGMTVLFLDKDGFVLDDKVREAAEEFMLSWNEETKKLYTGQYRVEEIDWHSSYTGLTDGYIDVFRAAVACETAEGAEEAIKAGGGSVRDGWAEAGIYLAVYHDGGSVERTKWLDSAGLDIWPAFAKALAE